MSNILEVKQKYELELLKFPGVEGVGIQKPILRKEVIVVYLSNENSRTKVQSSLASRNEEYKKDIPKTLEGYEVKIKHTGSFRAQ